MEDKTESGGTQKSPRGPDASFFIFWSLSGEWRFTCNLRLDAFWYNTDLIPFLCLCVASILFCPVSFLRREISYLKIVTGKNSVLLNLKLRFTACFKKLYFLFWSGGSGGSAWIEMWCNAFEIRFYYVIIGRGLSIAIYSIP